MYEWVILTVIGVGAIYLILSVKLPEAMPQIPSIPTEIKVELPEVPIQIGEGFSEALKTMTESFSGAIGEMTGAYKDVGLGFKESLDTAVGKIDEVTETTKETVENLSTDLKETVTETVEGIKESGEAQIDKILQAGKDLKDDLIEAMPTFPDPVEYVVGFGGKVVQTVEDAVDKVQYFPYEVGTKIGETLLNGWNAMWSFLGGEKAEPWKVLPK